MDDLAFMYEDGSRLRQRLSTLLVLGGFIVVALLFVFNSNFAISSLFSFDSLIPGVKELYIYAALGGLFFISLPIEAFFVTGLLNGANPIQSILAVLAGYVGSSVIDYVLGWKLRSVIMPVVSAKKLYGIRRWVGKYGSAAVFFANLLPVPAPLLTFALGLARYNVTRLFVLLTAGSLVKYTVIATFLVYVL